MTAVGADLCVCPDMCGIKHSGTHKGMPLQWTFIDPSLRSAEAAIRMLSTNFADDTDLFVHPLCNADAVSISICDAIEVPYC